jgi:hypothetical protein
MNIDLVQDVGRERYFVTSVMKFRLHKMREISLVGEELLLSQGNSAA